MPAEGSGGVCGVDVPLRFAQTGLMRSRWSLAQAWSRVPDSMSGAGEGKGLQPRGGAGGWLGPST